MKAITLRQPAGLENLRLVDLPDPGQPGAGELRVRVHASSLNFHDLGVVTGRMPSADGRIPMSDGAGVVEAVGEGVDEFAVGDAVVSTFFPTWLDGGPDHRRFRHRARRRRRRLCTRIRRSSRALVHARTARLQPRRGGDVDRPRGSPHGAHWWWTRT